MTPTSSPLTHGDSLRIWEACPTQCRLLLFTTMASSNAYDLQGQGGGQVYSSTDGAVIGQFRWVQLINDTTFSAFTAANLTNSSARMAGVSIPAGVGIGGLITGFTVTTGLVIAYRV